MSTPQEIEADIAQQREQLAATIDQLHARLQVRTRSTARTVAVTAGVALAGLLALTVWRRARQ